MMRTNVRRAWGVAAVWVVTAAVVVVGFVLAPADSPACGAVLGVGICGAIIATGGITLREP